MQRLVLISTLLLSAFYRNYRREWPFDITTLFRIIEESEWDSTKALEEMRHMVELRG